MLNKEQLKREIEAGEKALIAHQEGIDIHKVVTAAFRNELKKLNEKK